MDTKLSFVEVERLPNECRRNPTMQHEHWVETASPTLSICRCVYLYKHVLHKHMYLYCVFVCIYIYIYIHLTLYYTIYLCIYVYTYVCVCILYIYIYIHTYTCRYCSTLNCTGLEPTETPKKFSKPKAIEHKEIAPETRIPKRSYRFRAPHFGFLT